MSERFPQDWLKLRESADLAARSPTLARRFAAALPARRPLRLIDLGSGTGANTRALLPRITGDQDWRLIDRDRELLVAQAEEFTLWARRQGYPITAGGGRARIEAQPAHWEIEAMPLDLDHDLATLGEAEFDGITAASFFDLVSREWLERFIALLVEHPAPFLAVLNVDGRREWQPQLADDALVAEAFAAHQRRVKDFGAALGSAAPDVMDALLQQAGFHVERAATDWRLAPRDAALLAALIAGEAAAAREAAPEAAVRIDAWEQRRGGLLGENKLALIIGHCDLLALPA
ncbi:MAG TPA: class I SAM-dependent methyltransferase [Stellaceae bacterium]|nr:class I SAM-dependent methyltransferase [Stellaceae bacterium]